MLRQVWSMDKLQVLIGFLIMQTLPIHRVFQAFASRSGIVPVQVSVTSDLGCSSTLDTQIVVLQSPILGIGNSALCQNQLVSFTSSVSSQGLTYQYFTINNQQIDSSSSLTFNIDRDTTFTLELTAADSLGCENRFSNQYVFNRPPIAYNQFSDTVLCLGDSVLFQTGIPAGFSVEWSDSSQLPNRYLQNIGSYSFEVTDTNGCKVNSIPFSIQRDSFKLNTGLGVDTSLCLGNTISTIGNSQLISQYLWSDGSTSQQIAPNTSGSYWVELSNSLGCQTSDTINVIIKRASPCGRF